MHPTTPHCKTLPDILDQQAQRNPDKPALIWQGQTTSYAQLQRNVKAVASRLMQDGDIGDRIALLSWNSAEFVTLMYAIPTAGRILVPLNARLASAEWLDQLTRSGSGRLFADPQLLENLQANSAFDAASIDCVPLDTNFARDYYNCANGNLPELDSEDIAWILFTSGSTGKPKGAMLSHRGFIAGLRSAALARPVEPNDRYLYPFPLFHVAAHNVLLQHLYGAAVVLLRAFDAGETITACQTLGVTSMSLAPTMIGMLFDHPDFKPELLNTVRSIGYGASAMPLTLLQALLEKTRVGLCQSYGMTELCGSVAFLTVEDHRAAIQQPHLLRSVGKVLPTAEVKLVDDMGRTCATGDVGEILVRAEQCLSGYWQDKTATDSAIQDSWLHTGDVGRFDESGNLYIVDRKKDMILSGGENIASREVEDVLRKHPAVKDCAVIGLPDARWGESVCAVIQTAQPIDEAALAAHCRSLLAGYKTPRNWFTIDTLPVNAGGKVDKPLLRQRFSS